MTGDNREMLRTAFTSFILDLLNPFSLNNINFTYCAMTVNENKSIAAKRVFIKFTSDNITFLFSHNHVNESIKLIGFYNNNES